jgi:hypothetical protein
MTKSPLGDQIAITWYSFQDNTPVNSAQSASGNRLIPYVTVAVPFRFLTNCAGNKPPSGVKCGTMNFGDKLYLTFLKGQKMPNGKPHSGWVEIQDFCGDSGKDGYCFQKVNGTSYPNVDLYIGDFPTSGMKYTNGDCTGPAGNGQQVTTVFTGNPGAQWFDDYGGKALGSGKCGDYATAEADQGGLNGGCWDYTPPPNNFCASCMTGIDCN